MRRTAGRLVPLVVLALAACSPHDPTSSESSTASPARVRSLKPAIDTRTVVFNLGEPPRTLDPALTISVVGFNVVQHVFEGLTMPGPRDSVEPGVAERWEISEDGLTYDFYLRQSAKWADGEPVTAEDFIFAWTRVLAPDAGAAYANLLFAVENGDAFHEGEITDPAQLGLEAVTPYHLRVRLSRPVSYFLHLTGFNTLSPLRRDVIESHGDAWTHSPATYLGNGPFRLTAIEPNHQYVFEKSPEYWNSDAVSLDRMVWLQMGDEQSEYTAYLTNQIDATYSVPLPDLPHIRRTMAEHLMQEPLAGTHYLYFNFERPPLDDARVRRALMLAIDRETITNEVSEGLHTPATGWVPAGTPDADGESNFSDHSGALIPSGAFDLARELLAEAGYPGGEGFPAMTYLYNSSELNRRVAERLQAGWKRELGIDVRLQNNEWQVLVANLQEGNFDIGRFSWIGDYPDPMTFLDIWMSGDGNNRGRYRSEAYDDLLREAMNTADRTAYFELCHRAEQMLIDDAAMAPIWFTGSAILVNPGLEGVVKTPTGDIMFHHARWNLERLREGNAGSTQ